MRKEIITVFFMVASLLNIMAEEGPQVRTRNGVLEGCHCAGVSVFKGVAFAKPPVGSLRWQEPQPVEPWQGVRKAVDFGPNPMQENIFGDMLFSTKEMSEDCLYLNIWTPSKTWNERLPVFIYFNGGGLMAGSGSEPRYAGMTFARRGVIAITANYREGIFGFFSHPELSKESTYKGSGNYGFLDQVAAIRWVRENISAFGGDPERITIMGESAGSMSVSALMASPLSRNIIAQAMGSSGSVLGRQPWSSLRDAEREGVETMKRLGCKTLEELRAIPAADLLKRAAVRNVPTCTIDGYFMPKEPMEIYSHGEQAKVPCLIGNNNAEMSPEMFLGGKAPTMENFAPAVEEWSGRSAEEVFARYGISSDKDILSLPGYSLAGDMFIAYSTWKWIDMQQSTSPAPVFRYLYCHPRPDMVQKDLEAGLAGGVRKRESDSEKPRVPGAIHSADIEYQMGTLPTNRVFSWQAEDYAVSEVFVNMFVNFIKYGDPNALGLPRWEPVNGRDVAPVMMIDVESRMVVLPDVESRYRYIDSSLSAKP